MSVQSKQWQKTSWETGVGEGQSDGLGLDDQGPLQPKLFYDSITMGFFCTQGFAGSDAHMATHVIFPTKKMENKKARKNWTR